MPKRILIINPFGVGDVLFSTPLISAIREKYLGPYIGYICNRRTKEMLETNPDVDEIFVFERSEYRALWKKSKIDCIKKIIGFWKEIKKSKFDIVFDLSLGKEYAFLCWFSGIKERRGFDYRGHGRFLTHRIAFNGFNDKPVAEYYMELLSKAKPWTVQGLALDRLTLVVTDEDNSYIDDFLKRSGVREDDFLIGIAPGGGVSFGKKDQERRRWGAGNFSELSDGIAEKFKAKMILVWGPGEEDLVDEIAGSMKQKALVAPETTIRQMAALCKRCKVVICSEGGPLHIASSQGIKTISMFGAVDEKAYGPYPPGKDNIVITANTECRPCYKRFKLPECNTKKCVEDISVDMVFDAFSNIYREM
ncbi:MAG: glycosyltransferase family 9 protein [Candidatus Omnitrophica bacterium]|nr:glycosyltransferase family 9 protein [Candidatus Omnitrophota bacterium]MBU4590331.1 glycosyltransferase family 9 protein [Candidatus Omnitrophota bacterium]